MRQPIRICLGPGAPEGLSQYLEKAGLELLSYGQKRYAAFYIDFAGARPSTVPSLSIDFNRGVARRSGRETDFTTDNFQSAACFILSHVLKLTPAMLSADPQMLTAIQMAVNVAPSPVGLILSGEIGSGKQALARLIHNASRRRGPFTVVNCASLSPTAAVQAGGPLAIEAHAGPGFLPEEEGCTAYLDEIGELSMHAQMELERILRASEMQPWVQSAEANSGVRYVAATNRPLSRMVEQGELRKELFWRLNVFTIEVPPLRKRNGDVGLLARHFLHQANPRRRFSPMALKMLQAYPFPGNVRELQSLVARLAIAPLAADNHLIDVLDVQRHLVIAPGADSHVPSGWKTSREEARREMVLRAIAATGGNRAAAARRLGITPRALQYHITKAGLSRPRLYRAAAMEGRESSAAKPTAREPRAFRLAEPLAVEGVPGESGADRIGRTWQHR